MLGKDVVVILKKMQKNLHYTQKDENTAIKLAISIFEIFKDFDIKLVKCNKECYKANSNMCIYKHIRVCNEELFLAEYLIECPGYTRNLNKKQEEKEHEI